MNWLSLRSLNGTKLNEKTLLMCDVCIKVPSLTHLTIIKPLSKGSVKMFRNKVIITGASIRVQQWGENKQIYNLITDGKWYLRLEISTKGASYSLRLDHTHEADYFLQLNGGGAYLYKKEAAKSERINMLNFSFDSKKPLPCVTLSDADSIVPYTLNSDGDDGVNRVVTVEERILKTLNTFSNEILNVIRDYCDKFFYGKSTTNQNMDRTKTLSKFLAHIVPELCSRAVNDVLVNERGVIELSSPCIVFGDIHGNLKDLYDYEKIFWKSPNRKHDDKKFMFLGDFVDRGPHSVECAVFLIALKVLDPKRFTLVRGNHEVRVVNRVYTFLKECNAKFGKNMGNNIWDAISNVFDRLPIAAVIDSTVLCVHGGIPKSTMTLSELANIPKPLVNPEKDSPAAHEVLWSDPIDSMPGMTKSREDQLNRDDVLFIPNHIRKTAYYYTERAVDNFFAANGITHMVRAHELVREGYRVHFGGKVFTVFSSSNYGGAKNFTACVLIDRVIQPLMLNQTQSQLDVRSAKQST